MLAKRVLFRAAGAAVVGLLAGSVAIAIPAYADYVVCPTPKTCYVVVTDPGGPGGGGGTPGGGGGGGGGDSATGCTYSLADPQPPAGDPTWEGHAPGDGAVYLETCKTAGGPRGINFTTRLMWAPTAPTNTLTPTDLAQEAIKALPMRGPAIGIVPNPNGTGLVGLPVWMWNNVSASTWGPVSATASVPGLSVTATGNVTKIVWSMGDGGSVTCANPGTAYSPSYGNAKSPNCGYVYGRASADRNRPGGRYTVTAISTWNVKWAGGGANGELTVTRQSQTTIQIYELQVVSQ